MARDDKARTVGRSGRAQRVDLSLAQIEADIARRQARWRDVRARHEREARRDLDEQDDSPGGSTRVQIDFDELIHPFQVVTHPFGTLEEATRG